jgi:hypothetical protein
LLLTISRLARHIRMDPTGRMSRRGGHSMKAKLALVIAGLSGIA